MEPPQAIVRLYGHPITNNGEVVEVPLQSEFIVTGGMHLASSPQEAKGACFHVQPIDYSGLSESFPRAHYSHLLILHNFNWDTRRGEYLHVPYGGRIEIEAV